MYEGVHGIYGVQNYLQFQDSTGGSQNVSLMDKWGLLYVIKYNRHDFPFGTSWLMEIKWQHYENDFSQYWEFLDNFRMPIY